MRMVFIAVLTGLFLIALGLTTYGFGQLRGSFVPKQSVEELARLLEPHIEVITPEGEGPFPVVLAFHGCGGLVGFDGPKTIMREYADDAAAGGIATIIVDSLTPRRISFAEALENVCSGRQLRGAERAGDVVAALHWALRDERFDTNRVALAGWSHGAWSIMDAMTMAMRNDRPHNLSAMSDNPLPRVAAVHLTYPYCGFPSRSRSAGWRYQPQTRIVLAELDETAPTSQCITAVEKMREQGVPVTVTQIAGATHGFDEADQVEGSKARFDAAEAARAREAYVAWLRERLSVTP